MTGLFPGPVLAALASAPDRPALVTESRSVSGAELLTIVYRLANALNNKGYGPGSGIAFQLPQTPEAYAAHLAAHLLGCRVAAFRPGWSPPQLADAVAKADVAALFTDLNGLLNYPHAEPLPLAARPGDIARLTYTSGSTGDPKACAHTYEAMSLAYQPDRWAPVLADLLRGFERCLIMQNLASPVMFTFLGRCLVVGGTGILGFGLDVADAVERFGVTAVMMQPSRLDRTLRDERPLTGLRAILLGGSPAGPALLRTATERLGPIVWQGYGQGESGVIAMLTPDDILDGAVDSVGRPFPAVQVEIRDGEVCVHSPHQMVGYWNDPEQTADVLRDGWIHTRDLGHVGPDGRLRLTGRARDVILVNAEVCYAGAIERVLLNDPCIAQAYVVGTPDAETGEAVHAFVVPVAGAVAPDPHHVRELVQSRLGANSRPATVTVIHEVPMNVNGKPDKRQLSNRVDPRCVP